MVYLPMSSGAAKLNVMVSTPLSSLTMSDTPLRVMLALLEAKSTPLPVPSLTTITTSLGPAVRTLPSAGVMDVMVGTWVS